MKNKKEKQKNVHKRIKFQKAFFYFHFSIERKHCKQQFYGLSRMKKKIYFAHKLMSKHKIIFLCFSFVWNLLESVIKWRKKTLR